MNELILEIRDQPDVLVRIIQVIHRRGGRIRSLQVATGAPWAAVHISAEDMENPLQVTRSLEKLVDVHSARFITEP